MFAELTVRPALLSDLPQILQIINYWISTSTLITRENPLALVDITELYRKVKALGLPFLVVSPVGQIDLIYGTYFAWPEVVKPIRLPGLVSGAIYSRPGIKGLNLFQIMQAEYMSTVHKLPWFRGAISENSLLNSTMLRKIDNFPTVGHPPVVIPGVAVKRGQWIDQRLTFIPRAAGEQLEKKEKSLRRNSKL